MDELYARDGTCETGIDHVDPLFGHFTALPPANNYQALCTTTDPGAPCEPLPPKDRELRFTVDAAGKTFTFEVADAAGDSGAIEGELVED